MPDLNDWNIAAASNNSTPPDGFPEGMNYSEVNDSARENMAVLRRFFGDINGSLAAAGLVNAYTLTLNAGYTAYFDGLMFACTIPLTNTSTTPTINVNAIGARTIVDVEGNALGLGVLKAGGVYLFADDGTNLRLLTGSDPLLQKWAKGADVASATNMTLGDDGNFFDITGTTTIATIAAKGVGTVVLLQFDSALTLTHSADLSLPGGADITTLAGDRAIFVEYAAGDWQCISYQRNQPVVTDHVRAGNTQIDQGDVGDSGILVTSGPAEGVYETFGPTGSGADNIWTALDNLPANARILKARVEIEFTTSGTGFGSATLYAVSNTVTTPGTGPTAEKAQLQYDPNSASALLFNTFDVEIPLDANQIFKARWNATGESSVIVALQYRGFICD